MSQPWNPFSPIEIQSFAERPERKMGAHGTTKRKGKEEKSQRDPFFSSGTSSVKKEKPSLERGFI